MPCSTSDPRSATYATCCVVSRHVACVSRHFFAFATFVTDDILFRQPFCHDICFMSRHDISRHDICVPTCRDMSRHNTTYTHLCCLDVFIYLFLSLYLNDIVHVSGYSVNDSLCTFYKMILGSIPVHRPNSR